MYIRPLAEEATGDIVIKYVCMYGSIDGDAPSSNCEKNIEYFSFL